MANVNKELIEKLTVREVIPSDTDLIKDFFAAMGAESRALFNRRGFNERGILKYLSRPDATRKYFLALIDGKMAGYFFFLDFETSIPEMGIAVRDDLHGMGLGTHLVALAKKTAINEKKGGLQLTTHVANLRAQTLYESAGFVNRGRCKNGSELFYLWSYRKKDVEALSE